MSARLDDPFADRSSALIDTSSALFQRFASLRGLGA
jgi:hypothetical protein